MWLDFLMVGLALVLGWLGWVLVRCGEGYAAIRMRDSPPGGPSRASHDAERQGYAFLSSDPERRFGRLGARAAGASEA